MLHPAHAFRLHEAAALSGFSKYMLDYLAREDVFRPEAGVGGRGVARRYSFADIVVLRALRQICKDRGRIRHLRVALSTFRDEFGPIEVGQRIDQLLFVQGGELCLRTAEQADCELRTGQLAFSFVVDLDRLTQEVSASLIVDSKNNVVRLEPSKAKEAEAIRQKVWAAVRQKREQRRGAA
ncbi:MerR family transcriptional regulator [Variovorax sp. MHTC-1]|uniref:MerR family transcriptional regulator n=1 Tax=Variovorax sp. MHTC-1 TaxID=2495593 RepID=UPI000F8651C8|nr:MerR family transcriptional regulator [Variovorax sp. MHTC-1]RST51278.1 MerR family transcriptional regulator [Variovorax sp. MHTC-1]